MFPNPLSPSVSDRVKPAGEDRVKTSTDEEKSPSPTLQHVLAERDIRWRMNSRWLKSTRSLHSTNPATPRAKLAACLASIGRRLPSTLSQQDGPKPAEPDHRVRPGPTSACEPLRDIILKKLDDDLSGQRIYQDLRADHDFAGSYSSVRRFIAGLGKAGQLPFRRLECEPAEEAQVDFGSGAPVVDCRRASPQDARLPHRAQSQPQGVQRSGLPAEHGELHPRAGELFLLLWRNASRRW